MIQGVGRMTKQDCVPLKTLCRMLLRFKEALPWSEITTYDFMLPSNTCQRHLEIRAADVRDLVQSD